MHRWRVILTLALAWPSIAFGALEVVDDEIIFTIDAPGASSVYLAGDFNNWNPTLEKMERIGNSFQSILFIEPGVYRYKFVVDGEWRLDPDNKYGDDQGSLVVLEDRVGEEVVGLVGVASHALGRAHLGRGVAQGLDEGGRQGKGDVPDAEANQAGVRVRLRVGADAPADLEGSSRNASSRFTAP